AASPLRLRPEQVVPARPCWPPPEHSGHSPLQDVRGSWRPEIERAGIEVRPTAGRADTPDPETAVGPDALPGGDRGLIGGEVDEGSRVVGTLRTTLEGDDLLGARQDRVERRLLQALQALHVGPGHTDRDAVDPHPWGELPGQLPHDAD